MQLPVLVRNCPRINHILVERVQWFIIYFRPLMVIKVILVELEGGLAMLAWIAVWKCYKIIVKSNWIIKRLFATEYFNKVYAELTDIKYEHNDITLKIQSLTWKILASWECRVYKSMQRKFVNPGIGYYHNTFNNKRGDL